jgi:hypothetical protein
MDYNTKYKIIIIDYMLKQIDNWMNRGEGINISNQRIPNYKIMKWIVFF